MRRVIDGLAYDTDKAREVASHETGYRTDAHWVREVLYKTKRSRYFLYGEGGPLTTYRQAVDGNACTSGVGIAVLDDEAALAWCEQNSIDADVIEQEFDIEEA